MHSTLIKEELGEMSHLFEFLVAYCHDPLVVNVFVPFCYVVKVGSPGHCKQRRGINVQSTPQYRPLAKSEESAQTAFQVWL